MLALVALAILVAATLAYLVIYPFLHPHGPSVSS
jgi:hypothetical protein